MELSGEAAMCRRDLDTDEVGGGAMELSGRRGAGGKRIGTGKERSVWKRESNGGETPGQIISGG